MKRVIAALLLAAMLFAQAAFAETSLEESLFDDAKQAVSLLSYGETKKALKKLAFSSNAPKAADFADYIEENLSDITFVAVQTDVAVAYYIKSSWRLAVPIEEPSYRGVQTLVLRSKNGKSFDAYKAMTWGAVQDEIADSDDVIWQYAYEPGELYIVSDDD